MRALATLVCLCALTASSCSNSGTAGVEPSLPRLPGGVQSSSESTGIVEGTGSTQVTRLHVVGDSMLHTELLDVEPDFGDLLSDLDGLFLEDDLTLLNLECPASELGEPAENTLFALRCNPAGLPALAAAGVDVVSVANDTSLDLGPGAADDTVQNIEAAGMVAVGMDDAPAVLERDGRTIAIFGFTTLGQRALTPDDMAAAIAQHRSDVDVVLVMIHWGEAEDRDPNPDDVALAKRLADAGADAIYGHGPHRLQSLRIEDGTPVAFSLGHFLWPLNNERDPDSAVAYSEIDNQNTVRTCLLPATIRTDGRPALDRPTAGCDVGADASLGVN